jgi:hypothetical protein
MKNKNSFFFLTLYGVGGGGCVLAVIATNKATVSSQHSTGNEVTEMQM